MSVTTGEKANMLACFAMIVIRLYNKKSYCADMKK